MNKRLGIILAPLSALYSAVGRVRRALYRKGVFRVYRINAPVISVGNITTGGTGKTPLVAWIARAVASEGRRVCILSRGYARADADKRVVVSDGEQILADAIEGGDEPRLLAELLQGTASVISDADRVSAAHWAVEKLGSDAFILDDGFQHLRIARDLDVVTIDATNSWGGEKLLPVGRLREPLRELARADCLIITRSEQAHDIDSLRKRAERLSGGRPVLICRSRTSALRLIDERSINSIGPDIASDHPLPDTPQAVAAFCGVGNPESFFEHVRRDGHELKLTRGFADHHIYRQAELDILVADARRAGADRLFTTSKDAVKLRTLNFDLPCYVLEVVLEFDDEEKLLGLIREAILRKTPPS